MNVLILSKNYEQYRSGYYHQDIIDSFVKLTNAFVYGPGYSEYSSGDDIDAIIEKSGFSKSNLDLIVCSTSWDVDTSMTEVDPHPNIDLSKINDIQKIYFLNKEYKKLDLRFDYIKKQKFDLVCTVHPDAKKWEKEIDIPFLHLPFGISLERFQDFGQEKKYDFSFTGGLHKSHTDFRYKVKEQLFDKRFMDMKANRGLSAFMRPSPLKKQYKKYSIYWAEWGSRDFFYRSMLPKGKNYAEFMNKSKVFLNTPSAIGIFNTRFFELMATKALIFCPKVEDQYMDFLIDGQNCVMFDPDMHDFDEKLIGIIEDDTQRKKIVENAYQDRRLHSYDSRIKTLLDYL